MPRKTSEDLIWQLPPKLSIIHELDPSYLQSSSKWLQDCLCLDEIELISLDQLTEFAKPSAALVLHLALDKEIYTHRKISQYLSERGVLELNPYQAFAELCDDKYLFYEHMLAAELPQAKTQLFTQQQLGSLETTLGSAMKPFVLKPRRGTEKLDFWSGSDMEAALKQAQQIWAYDDLLLQDYIEHRAEYRVLYLAGKLYTTSFEASRALDSNKQVQEIIEALESLLAGVWIFAIDILDTGTSLIVLEANIRPARIGACVYRVY